MSAVDIEAEDSEIIGQPRWEAGIREGADIVQMAADIRDWGNRFPPRSYEAILFRKAADAVERLEMPVRRKADAYRGQSEAALRWLEENFPNAA